MKILFLCRENVGRSQMAEALFNLYAEKAGRKDISSISAGTHAETYDHFGKPIRPMIPASLAEDPYMLNISQNISKQDTKEMLEDVDKIVMMAKPELLPKFFKNNSKLEFWKTPDMKNTDMSKHREVRENIREKVEALIAKL